MKTSCGTLPPTWEGRGVEWEVDKAAECHCEGSRPPRGVRSPGVSCR